ncbi:hypothetical protein BDF14DRAFT_1763855 [Spinellus fusiger]|nr:hypothetical protein BDF14DRAFT_1763855 [Spinellus fusiger]
MFTLRARQWVTPARRAFATIGEASKNIQASTKTADKKFKVVVVGGGPGGLSVSSTLSELLGKGQVAVIEPSNEHYYQPLWTYVGGGIKDFGESVKPMGSVMPKNAEWIQDKVTHLDPENNQVTLADGQTLGYEYLVVAAGLQINWEQIKGLKEALGKEGVTSNYSKDSVKKSYQFLKDFKGGNAIFTFPNTPIKCPGAPVKMAFLSEEAFRIFGTRDKANVIYNTSLPKIFGIQHYAEVLEKLAKERNIQVNYQNELISIDSKNREAVFRNNGNNSELSTVHYDFLHVTPPQGPLHFIKESRLADAAGWVDVNKETLCHNKYKNVYSLGDCSSLPTSKTAAAITSESGVLKHNLIADLQGRTVEPQVYDGYTSCPLIVGRKELVLAEFSGYTGQPTETFPFDQRTPNSAAQFLNKSVIPSIYWNGLLKGTWTGPEKIRNAFAPFRPKL